MFYVYILRSESNRDRTYVGYTNNLKRRLRDHNLGYSTFTNPHHPWKLEMYLAFSSAYKARSFERYLKEGGG